MKKIIVTIGMFLFGITIVFLSSCNNESTTKTTPEVAKSAQDSSQTYKDMVGDNPNAEADIKVVSDFVNSLVSGDTVKAKAILADTYMGYGPSPDDSSNSEQEIIAWQQNYKTQSNRKISFVTETFSVKSGDLKGDWVALWGDYSFTQDGKDIKFPLQYTARVNNGKIETDRVYYDRLYIVQKLGFKVTPPSVKK